MNKCKCKCLFCDKSYSRKNHESLKSQFKTTFSFSNGINKVFLFLRNDTYPYEFMNDWGKFNGTPLLEKETFYSYFNMESIATTIMQK